MPDSVPTFREFSDDDLVVRPLDGAPATDFDCGAVEQNEFLHERAWHDALRGITVTHVLYVRGITAAFVTLMADRIVLGPRERALGVSYSIVPAVKIAQLGVDRRFSGGGLGRLLVAFAIQTALLIRSKVGCRYVTLDARTEPLVAWYESQGFVRNRAEQKARVQDAERRGRPVGAVAVSMRFDLREAAQPPA